MIKLPSEFLVRKGKRADGPLKVTYYPPSEDEPVSIDLAVKASFDFRRYTQVVEEDIRIPLPNLFLAQKIRTHATRSLSAEAKRVSDLRDINTLVNEIENMGIEVPDEVIQYFLTPDVMKKFWLTLSPADHEVYRDWLDGAIGKNRYPS